MRPQEANSALDPRAIYWTQKLRLIRESGVMRCAVTSQEAGTRNIQKRVSKLHSNTFPPEILSLAALSLVLYRCNRGVEVPVAGNGIFILPQIDEDCTVHDLLRSMQSELEQSAHNAPCNIAGEPDALPWQISFFWQSEGAHSKAPNLSVLAKDDGGEISLSFTFDAGVYPVFFVEHIATATALLIQTFAGRPELRVGDVDALDGNERRRIVFEFNSSSREYPRGETLHSLIEKQARMRPSDAAVVYGDSALTYQTFNGKANQLARYLTATLGVQSGDTVGIMARRSEQLIVAMVGVLKAGAAYVPINPRHPWEIVRYMLQNAGVRVLIVDSESIGTASAFDGQLFVLDLELETLDTSSENPVNAVTPESLAYVIYTSGSTGKPKGVAVEHGAIINTIFWRNDFYGIGPQDVNLQMPSFAFDSSVVDIFCILAAGGKLVIPQEDLRLDSRYLTDLIRRHGVTGFIATPSYYKLLVAELREAGRHLRYVTIAGEALTAELVAEHAKHLPHTKAFNEYGPTENAVCSTACVLDASVSGVPIGKPIPNVQVFVLDERLRVCPVGVPGEIYLGGVGLARGYFNQDELTASRFIEHPVVEWMPGKVYKTGDRACWRPDGMLEFLGRLDNQVKIRGFRIELEDVEGTILKHPSVADAAVICKEDEQGGKYLATYVALNAPLTTEQLRGFLSSQLQYYAVPDRILVLDKLPLNLNGKVDRNKLRQRNDSPVESGNGESELSSGEKKLLAIACEVLSRTNIGIHDNFFEVGGNSLRVMEFFTRLRSSTSSDLTLLDIYAYPTIRELAHRFAI